jgi:hypothetical protein
MNEREIKEKFGLNSLRGANLRGADLLGANLRGADLYGADLYGADLRGADLRGADLRGADLLGANLRGAEQVGANLRGANLLGANLRDANLRGANLRGADLRGADLRDADLRGANLSQAKGIPTAKSFLSQFEQTRWGLVVFKAIGQTYFNTPTTWKIQELAFIEENVNPMVTVDCGCGVNFATLKWIRENLPSSAIWKCLIRWEDLADVVVPYHTDGKARCARLQLLEELKEITPD